MKKKKPPKLEKPSKIRRRLMRLWSAKVLEVAGRKCAICGLKTGDIVNGKVQKTDAHHIEDRRNHSLKFDVINGICLCVWHHKYSKDAAHQSVVFFSNWLQKNHPQQYQYILNHRDDIIDLNNRNVLYKIEEKLKFPISSEELKMINPNNGTKNETMDV